MFQLILWALAAGLVWCLVGVIYGKAPSDKKEFYSFSLVYVVAYLFSAIFMSRPQAAEVKNVLKVSVFIVPSSIIMLLGFFYLKRAMDVGSQGIAWSIAQSSVVVPFLGSTFFLGSKSGLFQWVGIVILGVSLALLSLSKQGGSDDNGKGFLKYTVLAFVLIGMAQFIQMIPGHIGCSDESLTWRVSIAAPASVIWWAGVCISQKAFNLKKVWKLSVLYGVVVTIGQILFYKAVDAGDACQMTAVVCPIAIGSCIFLFSLYCSIIRHEKTSLLSRAGILLNVAGIVLLSVK